MLPHLLRVFSGARVLSFCVLTSAYPSVGNGQSREDFLGTWIYEGELVAFTFVLRPDGTGYLADEIDQFPFTFVLDTTKDPALLDLTYEVEMAFGHHSQTLARLEQSAQGVILHWVSWPTRSERPLWPTEDAGAGDQPTVISFRRTSGGFRQQPRFLRPAA